MDDSMIPTRKGLLVIMMASGVVNLVASSYAYPCDGQVCGWAIAFACVPLFFSILLLCLMNLRGGDNTAPLHPPISIFLLLWCSIAAAVETYQGPFITTTNGYFSAWTLFLSALGYAYIGNEAVKEWVNVAADYVQIDSPSLSSHGKEEAPSASAGPSVPSAPLAPSQHDHYSEIGDRSNSPLNH
eukprot:CAMPEP_0119123426 /NCGR_PEP_ID=MMETSP1310-20130426/3375_1 /TAXON_ID=464262 /ORGANISM="Genus nov. species nov., Strain RCC2339" /LENGTH=184 /DNA_ID=CAMNT_0007113241 /DNA_START=90 /DNA_END=644 /DNA_ORIENTATION=+